ncbi:MAG: hypothetical protein R3A45_08440 [Bdellovibrionota bacterium]
MKNFKVITMLALFCSLMGLSNNAFSQTPQMTSCELYRNIVYNFMGFTPINKSKTFADARATSNTVKANSSTVAKQCTVSHIAIADENDGIGIVCNEDAKNGYVLITNAQQIDALITDLSEFQCDGEPITIIYYKGTHLLSGFDFSS